MDDIKKPLPKKVAGVRKPELDARLRLAGSMPKKQPSTVASPSASMPGLVSKAPVSLDGMTTARKPLQPKPRAVAPALQPPQVRPRRRLIDTLRRFIPIRWSVRITRSLQNLWQNIPFTRRFQITYAAVLILALVAVPVGLGIAHYFTVQRYVLSTATKQLIGEPAPGLDKKLAYNKQAQAFQYNPDATKGLSGPNASDGDNGSKIGGQQYYGVNLARAISKGQTFTDTTTKLSFTIAPTFDALGGKHHDGHIVYPFAQGQVVYTLKDNGLREDVVLPKPVDNISLQYKLHLPDTLEARIEPNGALGIYSADPALFGNISYGGSSDQQAVQQARTTGKKTNLVFLLPAPVIATSKGATTPAQAHFSLKGTTLSVVADGLKQLHYPISIDPSVVVQSANAFTNGNNEDNNASIATSSVTRGALTGGGISAGWANAGATFSGTTPYESFTTAVYNGYVYVGNLATNVLYYGTLNNGTISSFTATTAAFSPIANINGGQRVVAYNGYLYSFGAYTNTGPNRRVAQGEYYAKIGTNGDITSWTQLEASSPWGPRGDPAAAAYDGYMYLQGGCTTAGGGLTNGNCSVGATDTWSAPINADGTLGTWTQQTSATADANMAVTTARYQQTMVAYNGRLYIAAGCITSNDALSNCNTYTTDVSVATLGSNGAVNAWSSVSALQVGRGGTQLVVYNGYLYMLGGCNNQNCGGMSAAMDNEYAAIYANGSLGPWLQTPTTTSGGPAVRNNVAVFAYNGYLYQMGGCNNTSNQCGVSATPSNTSISAKIDSAGVISPFTSSGTVASTAIMYGTTVAWGGYLYIAGGSNSNTGGAANQLGTVQYAKINSDGTLGTWTTSSTSFNQTETGATFCGTAGNCPGRISTAVGVYNGYMYIAGGRSNGSGNVWSDVQSAPLNATTGAPGTWTTLIQDFTTNSSTYSNTNGISNMSMMIYDGRMYLIGGAQGAGTPTVVNTIYYTSLTTSGGVGSFATTSSLPNARSNAQSFVANGNLYVVGGGNSVANDNDDVIFTPINTNGTLASTCPSGYTCSSGAWVDANAAANGGSGSSFYAAGTEGAIQASFSNGYLYISGGAPGTGAASTNTVKYAKMNTNGSFGTWATLNSFTTGRAFFGQAIVNGYVYIMGGCSQLNVLNPCNSQAQVLNDVQAAFIGNGGGGSATGWTNTGATNLPAARKNHSTIAYRGYLYVMGGQNNSNSWLTDVSYSPITSTGNGSWTSTNAYTTLNNDQNASFVAYNGYMYKIAGTAGTASSIRNDVQYAPINANGSLGTWQYTWNNTSGTSQGGGLTTARYAQDAVAYNGRLYVSGGCTSQSLLNSCLSITNTVETALINADGTVGAWSTISTNLPNSLWFHRMVAYNGYIYVIAGCTTVTSNNCTGITSEVDYALTTSSGLASDAGCGSMWCRTADIVSARQDFAAYGYDGYLYILGGQDPSGNPLSDTAYAPIFANGSLGAWSASVQTFPTARSSFGPGAVYNGKFYIVGGCTGTGNCNATASADVEIGGPQSIPRVAHYSYLVDLKSTSNGSAGGDPQITRYAVGFTPASAGSAVNVCWQGATTAAPSNNNVFGSATCANSITSLNRTAWSSYGRYAFVYITLDDSQSTTYLETSQTSLTELDTYFHAAPARRLRMGQTFTDMGGQSGTNNQLDTEGP